MHSLRQRIDASGGHGFVRDYQPQWENRLHSAGLRLRDRPVPIYLGVAQVTSSAKAVAEVWLPYLMLALFKTLAYCLAHQEKKDILFSSLLNRQELQLLDVGRLPRFADLFGRFDTFLRREGKSTVPTVIEANFNNVEGLVIHHLSGLGGRQLVAFSGTI